MKDRPKNWDRFLLIYPALKQRGYKQKDVAAILGMSQGCVSKLLYGVRSSKKFNKWVKENLGVEL